MKDDVIRIIRTANLPVSLLDDPAWNSAASSTITRYWNGEHAPDGRHAEAQLLWTDAALLVRFKANRSERLITSDEPVTDKKTVGLWERDVCEIFIAPDTNAPAKYFEFEVAPTGEWLDLAIDASGGERFTDWDYASGMTSAARIEDERVLMGLKIPFTAFGKVPAAGDVWLGNLFRCVGAGPDRGYLAWRPTRTDVPSFHVPEAFGELHFIA